MGSRDGQWASKMDGMKGYLRISDNLECTMAYMEVAWNKRLMDERIREPEADSLNVEDEDIC